MMCWPILFVLFCLTACSVVFLLSSSNWMEVEGNPHAKRLFVDLLVNSTYNKLIRPVANVKDTLTVKLGLRLSQLIGIVSPVIFITFDSDLPFGSHDLTWEGSYFFQTAN